MCSVHFGCPTSTPCCGNAELSGGVLLLLSWRWIMKCVCGRGSVTEGTQLSGSQSQVICRDTNISVAAFVCFVLKDKWGWFRCQTDVIKERVVNIRDMTQSCDKRPWWKTKTHTRVHTCISESHTLSAYVHQCVLRDVEQMKDGVSRICTSLLNGPPGEVTTQLCHFTTATRNSSLSLNMHLSALCNFKWYIFPLWHKHN